MASKTVYEPQLATLVEEPPSGDEWLHEIKYDGYRIGCRIFGKEVALISRRGNAWTRDFPEVVAAAKKLKVRSALLDGEVAIVLPDGRTSFQALQNAFKGKARPDLAYFVFDLLELDGDDLSAQPLVDRKARLKRLLGAAPDVLRYSDHWEGNGARVYQQACRLGFEGIVSKRRDSPYKAGRKFAWLKTKCIQRQEFVIGGFTDPEGHRKGIGSVLVGFFEKDAFVFAGKVGTGFTEKASTDLRKKLEAIETKDCPFKERPEGWLGRNAHWVEPRYICEVVLTEWTTEGVLRHPSFQGLREDKRPREVKRDLPRQPGKPVVAGVAISNPDRVMYPELGIRKLELAEFYEAIAPRLLPHLRDRPLTLLHCPKGLSGDCTFMKHSKLWAPDVVRRVKIAEKKKIGDYLIIDDLAALIGVVQMDVLELHTWNTTFTRVEQPDRIVMDLDPGPKVPWAEVSKAALLLRSALKALGLLSWVKTTGGAGLHVVAPLRPELDWSECLRFSKLLALLLVKQNPKLYTTNFAKAGRQRQILIDYLRNNRTNTSVSAYSLRAKPRAPISAPLRWDELEDEALRSDQFTIRTVMKRLAQNKKDPWADYFTAKQRLTREMIDALERTLAPGARR